MWNGPLRTILLFGSICDPVKQPTVQPHRLRKRRTRGEKCAPGVPVWSWGSLRPTSPAISASGAAQITVTHGRRTQWHIIATAWLAFGLLSGSQLLIGRWFIYEYAPPWNVILTITFAPLLYWPFVTPLIFRTAARAPFKTGSFKRAIRAHVPLVALSIFAHTLLLSWGAWIGVSPTVSLRRVFLELIPIRAPAAIAIYITVWALGEALAYAAVVRTHEVREARMEQQMSAARLEALRAQLHPHFLFNTLNTVAMAVRAGGNQVALNAVLDLSELLRTMLRNDGRHEVALAEELAFTRRYVAIEQLRFEERLTVELSSPEDLADVAVPAVILQPLVENSLRHGLAHQPGQLVIRVRSERVDDRLLIRISDNGSGFVMSNGGHGVGLSNARARLDQLYGAAGSLRTHSEPGGALVELSIPFRRMPPIHETPA